MSHDAIVVGAGFAGSVLAERLASQCGMDVLVVERREHVGGNAYDEYNEHGVLVPRFGGHLFHRTPRPLQPLQGARRRAARRGLRGPAGPLPVPEHGTEVVAQALATFARLVEDGRLPRRDGRSAVAL